MLDTNRSRQEGPPSNTVSFNIPYIYIYLIIPFPFSCTTEGVIPCIIFLMTTWYISSFLLLYEERQKEVELYNFSMVRLWDINFKISNRSINLARRGGGLNSFILGRLDYYSQKSGRQNCPDIVHLPGNHHPHPCTRFTSYNCDAL